MQRKLILIRHDDGPRDDRVSAWALEHGLAVDYRHPFAGEALPEPGGDVAGVVIFGGPFEVYETRKYPFLRDEARCIEACLAGQVPLLGICQGAQQIAHTLGAEVGPPKGGFYEFGYYALTPNDAGRTLFPDTLHVAQAHFHTFGIPNGAELLASSALYPNQAFRHGPGVMAFQFHPEITKTGFRRLQRRLTGHYDKPGAQRRDEQDRLMRAHDGRIDAWFRGFLDGFFGS